MAKKVIKKWSKSLSANVPFFPPKKITDFGHFWTIFSTFFDPFWDPFAPKKEAKRGPKRGPEMAQKGSKNGSKKVLKMVQKWSKSVIFLNDDF